MDKLAQNWFRKVVFNKTLKLWYKEKYSIIIRSTHQSALRRTTTSGSEHIWVLNTNQVANIFGSVTSNT